MKQDLGLYLHIPFCAKKCAYCDFLSWAAKENEQERYVQALLQEINAYQEFAKKYEVSTIFLGGGTPSILTGQQIRQIMEAIRENFAICKDAEITIEANPGTVTGHKLEEYRLVEINRISFGLQSVHDKELKMLGRIHTFEDFLESYEMAEKAGFTNINVDIMFGIPNQKKEDWEKTLIQIAELTPAHISAYSLIVEEGTPFYNQDLALPQEEEERLMYQGTKEILGEYGYRQYEISNYARRGFACRHNIRYWQRKNYLGLGLGAASLLENVRFSNTRQFLPYMKKSRQPETIRENQEILDTKSRMEEFMFLGLRMNAGVSKESFYRQFGKHMDEIYEQPLHQYSRQGFLRNTADSVSLTEAGVSVSNYILSEFLLDDASEHIQI